MNAYASPLALLLIILLLFFSACSKRTATWVGGIPEEYKQQNVYSIVAAVHGISEWKTSEEEGSVSLVRNFIPTNQITINTNTIHGWVVQIQPVNKVLEAEEYFILPKPAHWSYDINSQIISQDQTTCRTTLTIPKNETFVSHDWGMFIDDPIGEYEMVVFIDHKLAADFKFNVLPAPDNVGDKQNTGEN